MNRFTVGYEVAATTVAVTKDAKVETKTNVTTKTTTTTETAVAEEKVETEAVVEEKVETEAVAEGEVTTEEVVADEAAVAGDTTTTGVNTEVVYDEDMYAEDGSFVDLTMQTGMVEIKDPLLSSWPFVIGVSFAVLFVSMVLGALLAKRKIKKGIELYED